jgi:uncharacterized protein (TIGR03086 family)
MGMTDLRALHQRALDDGRPLLDRVGAADLDRATPCAGWDLRALVAHLIGQNHGFAEAVDSAAAGVDAPRSAFAARPADPDAFGLEWWASAERLVSAFAAASLDRPVLLVEISEQARFPVATAVGFQLLDTVVHNWDVATALGSAYRPDDELVTATLAQARRVPDGPQRRAPGAAFAPALAAPGGDAWELTLSLLGRPTTSA